MFSKCQLIKIPQLSGPKGSVYAVLIDDEQVSSFQKFITRYKISFRSEINDIVSRLKVMGYHRGMNENYFKLYEGNPGDGVCALYDKDKSNLRLYCIRYGSQLIILGGGAHKPKTIRAFQDDPDLKRENYILRELSKLITEKMRDKEIYLSEDGLDFEGELTIENLDYE